MAAPGPATLRYGARQEKGILLRRWMLDDPTAPPCPVEQSDLNISLKDIEPIRRFKPIENSSNDLNTVGNICARFELDIFQEEDIKGYRITINGWAGLVADTLIDLEAVISEGSRFFTSDKSNCLYDMVAFRNDLEYVFVDNIMNEDTTEFFTDHLFVEANGLAYPQNPGGIFMTRFYHSEDPDSYHGLLGTELGKLVGATVLGRWPRGTHHISYIAVSMENFPLGPPGEQGSITVPYMLFAIEPILGAGPVAAPPPAAPPAPIIGQKRRGENKSEALQPTKKKFKPKPTPTAVPAPPILLPVAGAPPAAVAPPPVAAPGPVDAPIPAPDRRPRGPGARKMAMANRAAMIQAQQGRQRTHRSGKKYGG
ncbi:hypothetical protein N7478_008690 [Penicillium angulare]|uniref:uncharacterized protein n=1 Tax=Penicillium angulare TaxID=116970 RepID=UPI002540D206|nr:uncharacterized protein N7478_008690 [Penicillium angulare]KAJ5273565.1 hypothetical protein N7478_008690 [Penicillium angulare]